MAERVSWATCPQCDGQIAVGWQPLTNAAGEPVSEEPVEVDCVNGCDLTLAQLRGATDSPVARPDPDFDPDG